MTRSLQRMAVSLASVVIVACHHAPTLPPVYPNPGFGRLGCYGGAGIDWSPGTHLDSLSRPATIDSARRAWMVVDSLSPAEAERFPVSATRYATIIYRLAQRKDSLLVIGAFWQPIGRDSVVIKEWRYIPATWYLARRAGDLRGVGVLVHDIRERKPDGTEGLMVSTWTVWLVPIPCSTVPLDVALPK